MAEFDINSEGYKKLGTTVQSWLKKFVNDRTQLEKQWLMNLRQYRGKYDPDVEKKIKEERSHAYPRDTRFKVKGFVAKMMEMMFPAQDRNWELAASPIPSIPKEALDAIIARLEAAEAQAAADEQRKTQRIPSEVIEREVRAFAEDRKDKMQLEIEDQLADPGTDYPQLAKRVIRSGGLYGPGIVRCPQVRTQKERVWEYNDTLGTYEAKTKTLKRPYPEFVKIWDFYPDLSAKVWEDQERCFERFVLARNKLTDYKKRPDFIKDALSQYLRDHQEGNYKPQAFETDLQVLEGTSNLSDKEQRRYEIYRHLGFVSAHDLAAAGVEIDEEDMDKGVLADIWFIDDVIIKAEKAAFGDKPCGQGGQYHAFIYTEDEEAGLTGIGLPEEIRDSQMGLCASTRAMFDNMAASAGPILEVNEDLLSGSNKKIGPIHAFMTVYREGDGNTANYPAIREIKVDSHVPELQAIIKQQREQLDMESNLPQWTFGANPSESLGEGVRTSFNFSQMTGGANMITKDIVRSFDRFVTSLIGSLLDWNMEFNPREEIKGDFQVAAKGNLSLVAREVRGAALDQFVSTLSQEERAILDTHGLLIDRLKARDLPTDRVLPEAEARQVLANLQAAAAQAAQIEQGLTQAKTANEGAKAQKATAEAAKTQASTDAVIKELLSRVEMQLASAGSTTQRTQLENIKILLEATANGQGGGQATGAGAAGEVAA